MTNRIDSFLELATQQRGSDLHLIAGLTPRIRINGVLQSIRFRELSGEDLERMLAELMTPEQRRAFEGKGAIDFGYEVPSLGRFRVNVYWHARGLAAVLRLIGAGAPDLSTLGLPESVKLAALQPKGLVLVTGPTGSGKTTTLAGVINEINATRAGHIITIEDPIEYVHDYKQCVITQREVGLHAPSFAEALRNAVREDPDVVLVGELRDRETIALALTAAETGIQVLGSLHTSSASRTVDRIINVFPASQQEQVRVMLADSLRMIVSQQLVPTTDMSRRVAVAEVLINTHAVAAMIRNGNCHKLESVLQAGSGAGMRSLDRTLKELLRTGVISGEAARAHAQDKAQFDRYATLPDAA